MCVFFTEMNKMRILLTGSPGVGKTTACINLAELLGNHNEFVIIISYFVYFLFEIKL